MSDLNQLATTLKAARADLKNHVYMQIAKMLSQLSTCNRLKVGAVLLGYDGSVVGTGYNGSLPGLTHCDEASCNASQRCLRTRHAERSALDYSQAKVATAYVTHEPCLRCTQDLIARGCKVIYFQVPYFGSPEEAEARARLVSESGATKVQLHLACHSDGRAALQAPTPPPSRTPTHDHRTRRIQTNGQRHLCQLLPFQLHTHSFR